MGYKNELTLKGIESDIARGMNNYIDFVNSNKGSISEKDLVEFKMVCCKFIGQLDCLIDNNLLLNTDIGFTKYSNKKDVSGVVSDIIGYIESEKSDLASIFLTEYGIDIIRCIRAKRCSEEIIEAINDYNYLRKDGKYDKYLELITNHFNAVSSLCDHLRSEGDSNLDEFAIKCRKTEKALGL